MRRTLASAGTAFLTATGAPAAPERVATDAERLAISERLAMAERLLKDAQATWVDDIAGFNRRTALCEADAAKAAAAYDEAHRTRFQRTLTLQWGAASSRWVGTPCFCRAVTLTYSGPVRSGTATIDGHARSFCRAEAPDQLATGATADPEQPPRFMADLPASPLGLGGGAGTPAYAGLEPATPAAEIAARIAKAQSLLDETLRTMDKVLAENRRDADCRDQRTAETMAKHNGRPARYGWVVQNDTAGHAMIKIVVRGTAYSGRFDDGTRLRWLCAAIRPTSVTASAMWQDEGDNVVSFSADVPTSPSPAGAK